MALFSVLTTTALAAVAPLAKPLPTTLKLTRVFTSNAVLQRDQPCPVFGVDLPGTRVTVTIAGRTLGTTADASGAWRVNLPAESASAVPRTLTVTGSASVTLTNLLVGDVWLISGQSNADFPLRAATGGPAAIAQATNTLLRYFQMAESPTTTAQAWTPAEVARLTLDNYFSGTWQVSSPASAGAVSAVGYFFAHHILTNQGTPIGLIDCAVGGTMAMSWLPPETIEADPRLKAIADGFPDADGVPTFIRTRTLQNLAAWDRAGRSAPMPDHPYRPGACWRMGLANVAPYTLRGVLWYQGESDADFPEPADYDRMARWHTDTFTKLVASWRTAWANPALPVYFVQLPRLNRPSWPWFRESQSDCARNIANTAMAVAFEHGNPSDVHPADKRPVGERLALIARARSYGEKIEWSGPQLHDWSVSGDHVALEFEHATGGLVSTDGKPLALFQIAGTNRQFFAAAATISSNTVIVSTPQVPQPAAVRYAWVPTGEINFFNGAGLPASPFRTDRWPVTNAPISAAISREMQLECLALIPSPQHVAWTNDAWDCSRYVIETTAEAPFAVEELERILAAAGARRKSGGGKILLRLGEVEGKCPEAYTLEVTAGGVKLTAPTPTGLLYGVQTLRQLLRQKDGHPVIGGCRISDWPAFAWRGFMHDLGRNFQDLALLKRFVDVMAQYKMNIFQFHLSDNPAYRVECRVHPELNDPQYGLPTRSPGKFYTYAELNDFFAYCRQRGITVVPEIDMPGHSAYFKRAFGVDMQDARGMQILSEALEEFFAQVNAPPYFHMGSDEVTVKNPDFMPRMAELIRRHDRQILVWRPGHLPPGQAITQLWSAGSRPNGPLPGLPAVDSRNDYVNHMDPFDGPMRILSLATCGTATGSTQALGGILCHWPDNNVGDPMNIYRQSPVFPALLAAAERYWCGYTSERPEYWGRLPEAGRVVLANYADFEARMLEHRDRYFADWPFPYVRQTNIPWKLIGVFDHQTNFNAVFPPEREIRERYDVGGKTYTWSTALGGTIHINHFWYDGWLPKAGSGTAYGLTYVWSPRPQTVGFWIGFNGPSRSDRRGGPNPMPGEWSTTGSRVWVNNQPVPPPAWQQPGRVPSASETPFVDEDYFYRAPTPVTLKAGWNKILIKAPKSANTWKWMFTCVPVAVQGQAVREVPELRFATSPHEP